MADNITLNAGSGGAIIATDDVGGVQYQLVKVTFGVDGTAIDVSAADPLPAALFDAAGADALGDVGATPAANTLLGRLKAISDAVAAQGGYVDGLEALITTLNGYVDGLEALAGTTNTTLTTMNTYVDGLEALITTLSGKLPSTIGAKASSNSLSIVPATDAEFSVRSAAPSGAVTATIPSGGSITPAIDLGAERLHRIAMPAAWTTASISFQTSPDGVTYNDLYDYVNGEVVATSAATGRALVLDQAMFYGIRYLKIRSGTTGTPVTQTAARDLVLVTVPR